MERYGLGGRAILYEITGSAREGPLRFRGTSQSAAEAVFRRADLLLNFHYGIDPGVLARFRRTALVDIDPGLLQFWMSRGQLLVSPHDLYLTIGETVGIEPSSGTTSASRSCSSSGCRRERPPSWS